MARDENNMEKKLLISEQKPKCKIGYLAYGLALSGSKNVKFKLPLIIYVLNFILP
jgi:hypothetical protein